MRSFIKIPIAISIPILLSGCGGGDPEEQAVSQFFTAVQMGDQATLERVGSPDLGEAVQSWEIVERGTESEAPFHLAELQSQLSAKRREVDAQKSDNQNFVGDNRDTYEAYTKAYAENPSGGFQGALLAFHEELQARQTRLAELEAEAEQLAFDVDALTDVASRSVATPVNNKFEGQIKVKPVQVKVNDGSGEKTYTFMLHRYDLTDTEQNRALNARWVVAEVQPS